jgi:DNA-damage-inducible protein J
VRLLLHRERVIVWDSCPVPLSYGLTLTDAINVFFHKSISERGLPFDLRPNRETLEAIAEVQKMKRHPERYKGYRDVDELFADALSERDRLL